MIASKFNKLKKKVSFCYNMNPSYTDKCPQSLEMQIWTISYGPYDLNGRKYKKIKCKLEAGKRKG